MLLRRAITTGAVFLTALILLMLQNWVLVGSQDLQAQLRPGADAQSWRLVLTDVAGNPTAVTPADLTEVERRLKGDDNLPALPVVSSALVDQGIALTLPTEADPVTYRARLTARAFKHPNEARDLLHITKGIDIRGGVEFICRLRDDEGRVIPADDETVAILAGRLDERGLTEPSVTRLSNGDVQVVIPGGTRADAARTRRVLETTGRLEFREVLADFSNVQLDQADAPVLRKTGGGYDFAPSTYRNRGDVLAPEEPAPGNEPSTFYRLGPPRLIGSDVRNAHETLHEGQLAVAIEFTAQGAGKNEQFTREIKARGDSQQGTGRLAIIFDSVVKSAPRVIEPSSQSCVISGRFTSEEIDNLKSALKGGSLTVTPEVISERVVGATLGEQTISKALWAMAISFLAIVVFMFVYYGWTLGAVANAGLVSCGLLIWGVLSMFGATVTLPGLAGLVLTIGMAVDTNILIFERIREELRADKGMKAAIEAGYDRALLTIIDAHLTTFITAFILYWIGSGAVKGFGLTLMIGILVNLFSGVYIGRMLTDWWCDKKEHLWMANWIPELKLPYVEWRWYGYIASFTTAVIGVGWFAFGHLAIGGSFERNFDIDFTGGNMAQVTFLKPMTGDQIETAINAHWNKLDGDSRRASLVDPSELRKQPYFAELGLGRSDSQQWVFRSRDEEGARLEDARNIADSKRIAIQRRLDAARTASKLDSAAIKAAEEELLACKPEAERLERAVNERTEAFKRELANAFTGAVANEGDEILAANWNDRTLSLHLGTVEPPTVAQIEAIGDRLRRRADLETVRTEALAGGTGLAIEAVFRSRPTARNVILSSEDPVISRLLASASSAATSPAEANALAEVALEMTNAVINVAAGQKLTVAKPFPSTEHFSGQVAGQMKLRALAAVLLALVAILAYVAMRFEFRFGIGAVVALFHDVLVTVGVLSVLDIRIDLTVIAAVLTIIGYSINDTIVTFDRIRENLRSMTAPLAEIIDLSVAQTMPRTVLTVGTVFITVLVLLVWGGEALRPFSATLMIGLIAGTYSSIFVASPLLLSFKGSMAPPTEVPADAQPGEAQPEQVG